MSMTRWSSCIIIILWILLFTGECGLMAQDSDRPTFLFPTSASTEKPSGTDNRRTEARQEGETALAMHAPELAEEKFAKYCELTPANLPEAGTANRLLAEAQFAYAENLLNQGRTEEATQKYQSAIRTAENYLALPDIQPSADDRDRLDLVRAQALLRLEQPEETLKILLAPERGMTANAHDFPVHWEALRIAARLHLARREWTAAINLLAPFFAQAEPTRKDAELLMLYADAELGRGDYGEAATHYAQLMALLPQEGGVPGELSGMDVLAPLHRIRALVGTSDALSGDARLERLNEARGIYQQIAPQKPATRDVEWGTAVWCLANEFARNANDPATAQALLGEAWELLPYSDAHWVETGMLLAQVQRQQNDPQAKITLEELRTRRPDSHKYGEFSLQLAEYRKEDNDRTRAAEIFQELATRSDLDATQRTRAAFGAAECFALDGKLDQALGFYRQAAESTDPRQAVTALLHAAQAATNAGKLDTAVALLTETADRFGKKPEGGTETEEVRKLRLRAAEARLDAALAYRRRNQPEAYAQANELLNAFLQEAPDSSRRDEARLEQTLLQCLMAGQDSEQLIATQEAFYQLANDANVDERLRTTAYFEATRIALRRQDRVTAGNILDEFLTAFPQSAYALRAMHRRILLAMQTGQSNIARAQTDTLLQRWPGTTEAAQLTLLLADTALAVGTTAGYREALRLYQKVRTPDYSDETAIAQAHYESANCLYLMAQQDNPADFIPTVPNGTDGPAPEEPISAKDAQAQLVAQAIAELEQINAAASPTLMPQVWMLHGELLALTSRTAEAREKFRLVREQAGNTDLGFAALGRMGEMLIAEVGDAEGPQSSEKLQEAIDTFAHILANARQDELLALAHFRTAQCLRELGRQRDAGKNYEDALRHYKEICVDYESAQTPERSPRYYTLAVFELADLAEEMADAIFLEQAVQFLEAYSQHQTLPFAQRAKQRAGELHQRAKSLGKQR